jgi:hypothetical protein
MGEWEPRCRPIASRSSNKRASLSPSWIHTSPQRASTIIRKVMPNALIDPRVRYIDMIDDRTDSRANYSGRAACGSALRSAWRRAAG